MARKSLIAKNRQRQKIVEKYADKRCALKTARDYHGMQNLPRNASPTRLRNRCRITGRGRGYLRNFEVSRIVFREKVHAGELPGVRKAS